MNRHANCAAGNRDMHKGDDEGLDVINISELHEITTGLLEMTGTKTEVRTFSSLTNILTNSVIRIYLSDVEFFCWQVIVYVMD